MKVTDNGKLTSLLAFTRKDFTDWFSMSGGVYSPTAIWYVKSDGSLFASQSWRASGGARPALYH